MELISVIKILFLVIYIVLVKSDLCPKQCDCDMDNGMNRALCNDQNIVGIEIGVPKQVQIYSLSHNVISELENYVFTQAGYTSLIILDLSYNHIGWVGLNAFSRLTNLTNLNLSYNRLGYIPSDLFWTTPQLELLDLSGNIFEKLKNEPFLMHEKLKVLNLKNSKINTLPTRMFMRLPNLRKLDLSDNYMVTMSFEIIKPLKRLERIELQSDYWRCANFKATESWILSQNIIYKKQCNTFTSKMLDKMISVTVNETEIDVADVWNITKDNANKTKTIHPKNLTPLQKFDSEFPAIQSFILGLEIGLAIGILGAYIWLRNLCKCGKLRFSRPETRRQRRRRQRIAENDMNANLLWSNISNPNVETPPPMRRELSLPEVSVPLPTYGLHSFTEASDLYDVIRPGRCETPPPPYHEVRLHLH